MKAKKFTTPKRGIKKDPQPRAMDHKQAMTFGYYRVQRMVLSVAAAFPQVQWPDRIKA